MNAWFDTKTTSIRAAVHKKSVWTELECRQMGRRLYIYNVDYELEIVHFLYFWTSMAPHQSIIIWMLACATIRNQQHFTSVVLNLFSLTHSINTLYWQKFDTKEDKGKKASSWCCTICSERLLQAEVTSSNRKVKLSHYWVLNTCLETSAWNFTSTWGKVFIWNCFKVNIMLVLGWYFFGKNLQTSIISIM